MCWRSYPFYTPIGSQLSGQWHLFSLVCIPVFILNWGGLDTTIWIDYRLLAWLWYKFWFFPLNLIFYILIALYSLRIVIDCFRLLTLLIGVVKGIQINVGVAIIILIQIIKVFDFIVDIFIIIMLIINFILIIIVIKIINFIFIRFFDLFNFIIHLFQIIAY